MGVTLSKGRFTSVAMAACRGLAPAIACLARAPRSRSMPPPCRGPGIVVGSAGDRCRRAVACRPGGRVGLAVGSAWRSRSARQARSFGGPVSPAVGPRTHIASRYNARSPGPPLETGRAAACRAGPRSGHRPRGEPGGSGTAALGRPFHLVLGPGRRRLKPVMQ